MADVEQGAECWSRLRCPDVLVLSGVEWALKIGFPAVEAEGVALAVASL
jgi:hypothetical protein